MTKIYRLLVFDWEGTLGDTLGQIFNSIVTEARRLNFGEIDYEIVKQAAGLGLVKALRKIFHHQTNEQHEILLNAVQNSLISRSNEVYLIPGAKDFVNSVQHAGIKVAIASNKSYQSLLRTLEQCGLDTVFKVICAADSFPPKPSPRMLEEILTICHVKPVDALMIGDSVTDIQMARYLEVDAVGMDFYQQHQKILQAAGALAVFSEYRDLANYLQLPWRKSN